MTVAKVTKDAATVMIRVPPETRAAIKAFAAQNSITISAAAERAISHFLGPRRAFEDRRAGK